MSLPTRVLTRVSLNLTTAMPDNTIGSDGKVLTTDPVIHQAGEIVEVDEDTAKKWTSEKYLKAPTKMCERKGGDFLPSEYITRANYV